MPKHRDYRKPTRQYKVNHIPAPKHKRNTTDYSLTFLLFFVGIGGIIYTAYQKNITVPEAVFQTVACYTLILFGGLELTFRKKRK